MFYELVEEKFIIIIIIILNIFLMLVLIVEYIGFFCSTTACNLSVIVCTYLQGYQALTHYTTIPQVGFEPRLEHDGSL